MDIEKIFKSVLDCSFRVHSALGPGLLESAYVECINYELEQSGLKVEKQKPLPLPDALADIHMAQILTYLKLSGCKLGLLANFNVEHLKDGIRRVIL